MELSYEIPFDEKLLCKRNAINTLVSAMSEKNLAEWIGLKLTRATKKHEPKIFNVERRLWVKEGAEFYWP